MLSDFQAGLKKGEPALGSPFLFDWRGLVRPQKLLYFRRLPPARYAFGFDLKSFLTNCKSMGYVEF
ncbi:MAG: hypothetical protein D6714_06755 [Bacteroidetes bacterium]|nr:MAG: hypothetical protein D6714_06755 [Bacteroidota bacterium]